MNSATHLRVERSIVVELPQAAAFERFVDMSAWWPLATHTRGTAPARASIVERHAGGRWYEIDANGDEQGIGHVVTFQPPDRIVLTWETNCDFEYDPEIRSTIDVRFETESPQRTRVVLEHRDFDVYGERAEEQRARYDGPDAWTTIVERFGASLAPREASAAMPAPAAE